MITEEELKLFDIFISNDVYNNDITYKFIMESGDILIAKYDGSDLHENEYSSANKSTFNDYKENYLKSKK